MDEIRALAGLGFTLEETRPLAMPALQLYVAGELVAEIVGARSKSRLIRELSGHPGAIG